MKIYAQSREGIYDFDSVYIDTNNRTGSWFGDGISAVTVDYYVHNIGIYKDKARAKEVIEEIVEAYKNNESVYYMPAE